MPAPKRRRTQQKKKSPLAVPRAVPPQADEAPRDPQGKPVLPADVFMGSALRAMQAQLACTVELNAEWSRLLVAASRRASQLWLGKR